MPAQFGSDHGGEVNHAAPFRRLRRPEREPPGDLVELPGDPDRASLQVDIAAAKRGQFAPAQTAETRQENESPIPRIDRIGDLPDLEAGDDGTLRRLLLSCSLDPARIAANQPIIDGRIQDGLELPVCLRGGDRAHPGVEQLLTPAADLRVPDGLNRELAQSWPQVAAEQVPVELERLGAQVRPFGDPRIRIAGERHFARIRVDPLFDRATDNPQLVLEAAQLVSEQGYNADAVAVSPGWEFRAAAQRTPALVANPVGSNEPFPISLAGLGVRTRPLRWDKTKADAIVADWTLVLVGLRKDITIEMFTSGVISDATGKVVQKLLQEDKVACRVTFRAGYMLAAPPTDFDGTPCPVAIVKDGA